MSGGICRLCLARPGLYNCQTCSRRVCQSCWRGGTCRECAEKQIPSGKGGAGFSGLLLLAGFLLFLFGVVLVVLGFSSGESSGGCFFWPLPLVFACGLGLGSSVPVFLVAAAAAVGVLVFWLAARFPRERL